MADNGSAQSPKINYRQFTSSIFTSPRLFTGLVSKGCNETESTENSPTSILDSKSFSGLKNSFWPESNAPKPECRKKFDSKPGLVDALIDEESGPNSPKPETRMILFGSQLKIQVPPLPPSLISPVESPKSPGDFGIKTRSSYVGPFSRSYVGPFSPGLSPSPVRKSPFGSSNSGAVTSLSASEMELSEDYTCVISYGPNPRITHIFDDCIVESCCGVVKSSELRKENALFSNRPMSYPSESFLSFCYNCKKNLGQGKDIYMYRGEKAFCSSECRYKEMMLEEEEEQGEQDALDSDDVYGTSS